MTIHLTRYFGACIFTRRDEAERNYLCACIWYWRAPRRLDYLYPAIRIR